MVARELPAEAASSAPYRFDRFSKNTTISWPAFALLDGAEGLAIHTTSAWQRGFGVEADA